MKKEKIKVFGKDYYLLGIDENKTKYYLEASNWDCNWYWGGGYVETFTNNSNPQRSKDIASHSHFNYMFFNKNKSAYDEFSTFFKDTPFCNVEIWEILELLKSFYIAREYSDFIYRGGAYYTSNPTQGIIKNNDEYKRINEKVIPQIMAELYKILEG